MKKKTVALLLALVLVFGVVAGGTLAWLTAKTDPVVNTFTTSDINITLTETGTDASGNKSYKMVPGKTLEKDPKVKVEANSEACWLFVKVEKSSNLDTYISYAVDTTFTENSGWKKLDNATEEVYYREISATEATAGCEFYVLTGNTVTVKDTVTKAHMSALKADGAVQPTLTFKAYAVQKEAADTAAKAWEQAKALEQTP